MTRHADDTCAGCGYGVITRHPDSRSTYETMVDGMVDTRTGATVVDVRTDRLWWHERCLVDATDIDMSLSPGRVVVVIGGRYRGLRGTITDVSRPGVVTLAIDGARVMVARGSVDIADTSDYPIDNGC